MGDEVDEVGRRVGHDSGLFPVFLLTFGGGAGDTGLFNTFLIDVAFIIVSVAIIIPRIFAFADPSDADFPGNFTVFAVDAFLSIRAAVTANVIG